MKIRTAAVSVPTITASKLAELNRSGRHINLIDVRTPTEFREKHVQGARNIPLARLDTKALTQGRIETANERLFVICRSGRRGRQACEKLIRAGFANIVNVEGGTTACQAAGMPIVHGKKALSLERQVRIAAGSMVLLGAALSWFVNPYYLGLSAFIGAWLVVAGITNTCVVGRVLARMPWNHYWPITESEKTR
jgi:rhodanese-related sulfurtransferase